MIMDLFLCVPNIIIFLIPLLPSSSAKISFCNTLLISEKTFPFTTKIPIALCWSIDLETLKVFSLCLHVASNPADYQEKVSQKIFPQPQECGARLVAAMNEPVPRPSATFFAFSQAKHFFFLTSWKYQQVPIWLKTLNPEEYAAKYWY